MKCANPDCAKPYEVVNHVPQMNVFDSGVNLSDPRIDSARELLRLSHRLAAASGWSIPAMRLKAERQFKYMLVNGKADALSYLADGWNFEEALQKRIAHFIDKLVSPGELTDIFILQWKDNLAAYLDETRKKQSVFKESGAMPPEFRLDRQNEREQHVSRRLPGGGRILYVGCGTGRECFRYEKMGYEVIGIDTDAGLLDAMQDWRTLLNSQARPVRMNAIYLGFLPQTFDAAIVEFYGALPSKSQRLRLQRELARVLKPGAIALVVGLRCHYTKYMQLQDMYGDHEYLSVLRDELLRASPKGPAIESDQDTDKIFFGAMRGSHTCDSLSKELSACFEVEECFGAGDKRYLLALAKPLPEDKWSVKDEDEPETIAPTEDTIIKAKAFMLELKGLIDVIEKNANAAKEFVGQSAALENETWERLNKLLWRGRG